MLSLILFWAFYFNPTAKHPIKELPANDLITIYGSCFDVLTGVDLKIKASALFRQKKLNLGESNNSGTFEFQIPDSTKFLSFEIAGYNSTVIPVNIIGKIEKGSKFKISVPMIAKSLQQITTVTQQPIKKNNVSDSLKSVNGTKKVLFEIKDAHIGKIISAKVCLNYTDTGQTKCFNVDSTKSPGSILLNQRDKIAFIVSASGFQDYIGNLINDQFDHNEELHQIKLLRSVNPLCLYYDVSDDLEVDYTIIHNQSVAANFTYNSGKHPISNYLYFIKPGQYQFTASTTDGIVLMKDNITTGPGFNLKSVRLRKPESNKPKTDIKENIVKAESSESAILYFDQSSYNLRNETKAILDSISRLLPGQPNAVINVTGFTDNVGNRDLNLRLSEYRARVVVNYLKQKGIPEKQISFTWKGADSPVAANDKEENKVKNRRVEVRILRK